MGTLKCNNCNLILYNTTETVCPICRGTEQVKVMTDGEIFNPENQDVLEELVTMVIGGNKVDKSKKRI